MKVKVMAMRRLSSPWEASPYIPWALPMSLDRGSGPTVSGSSIMTRVPNPTEVAFLGRAMITAVGWGPLGMSWKGSVAQQKLYLIPFLLVPINVYSRLILINNTYLYQTQNNQSIHKGFNIRMQNKHIVLGSAITSGCIQHSRLCKSISSSKPKHTRASNDRHFPLLILQMILTQNTNRASIILSFQEAKSHGHDKTPITLGGITIHPLGPTYDLGLLVDPLG
ncbi:hypothetical protein V2J09_012093 [Rumex salicifolius]